MGTSCSGVGTPLMMPYLGVLGKLRAVTQLLQRAELGLDRMQKGKNSKFQIPDQFKIGILNLEFEVPHEFQV